ncbi:MAG: LptF/LptG family permease, partial [Spirochaetia bacterium]|nr:LptF/LptG family permease [Spirochaetia bacterium]
INYFAFKIPFLATEGAPFAVMLSILYVFSQLNRNSELNAMKLAGINFYTLAIPVLLLALCISICTIVLNETVVSKAYERANYIKDVLIEKKARGSGPEIRKDLAKLGAGGKVFYIKHFDGLLGVMKGICILTFDRDFNLTERLDSREGVWAGDKWQLNDVSIRTFNKGAETSVIMHQQHELVISDTPDDFIVRKKNPEDTLTVNIFRLKKLITLLKESGFNANEEETNYYLKIAFPFASFILALLGISIPYLFPSTRSFVNAALGFIVTIVVAFFYMGLVTIGLSAGKIGAMPPWFAAWSANIAFAIAGFIVLNKVRK